VATAPVPRTGFDSAFLHGHDLPRPIVADGLRDDIALTTSGQEERDYTHFSLLMSASRRFCRWVAWNIDSRRIQVLARGSFKLDHEYTPKQQVGPEIYKPRHIDQGHIARRKDVTWGSDDEAAKANADSMFFTNITPQADDFNQSGKVHQLNGGLWGELENAVFDEIGTIDERRLSVFWWPLPGPTRLPLQRRSDPDLVLEDHRLLRSRCTPGAGIRPYAEGP
jgi:endonuclease G, mitochondrial